MDVSQIKPYSKNAKKHPAKQIQQVANSIKEFGFNQPIVVDKNGVLIVGHGRYEAAKLLGLKEVPTITLDISEEKANAYRLADNKLNESEWDMGLVIEELKGLSEEMFDLTGFDKDLLIEPDAQDDVIPENVPPRSKLGDLYELGQHRVLCGDSTQQEAVLRLMDGKKADMVLTDPPYGIGFEYNQHKDEKGEVYEQFCSEWFANLQSVCDFIVIFGGWAYNRFWYKKDPKDTFYWLSRNKRSGGSISHFRKVEPIFLWGKPKHRYDFDFFEQVTEIEQDLKGKHTCPKPVSLMVSVIFGSEVGEIILDIFLGSGTTLIASEKTGRICYGMELDCKYVDVCIERWCKYTGITKIKKNGEDYEWQLAIEV